MQDLRLVFRSLRATPIVTVVAILSLAVRQERKRSAVESSSTERRARLSAEPLALA